MALETLKDVKSIGEESIMSMDRLKRENPDKFNPETGQMNYAWFEKEIRPYYFIMMRHDKNSLTFTLQNGPIKEKGRNGCQIDHIVMTAKKILEGLDGQYPCVENKNAIYCLGEAIRYMAQRTTRRTKQGIEGTSKEEL